MMTPTTRPPEYPAFWRCDHCGTPNPSASYLRTCLGCGAPRPARGTETDASKLVRPPTFAERKRRLVLLGLVMTYGVVVLTASLAVRLLGEGWWPVLVLLMSPRWLFLAPALPLGIAAWRMKRPMVLGMVGLETLLALGPLMGFGVPWGKLARNKADGPSLRIMTFNRGGGANDVPRLARYIERNKIDVVCFQDFRRDPGLDAYFDAVKWSSDSRRSIASRYPIVAESPPPPERNFDRGRYTMTAVRVRIKGPLGREFAVASVQLPTLRPGLNRFLDGDLAGLRLQADWWAEECSRMVDVVTNTGGLPMLVAGDLNMPIESSGLSSLLREGVFQSAFEQAGWGWGYTRPAALPWVRIDHILAGTDWTVTRCWVGPAFGSDHRSLVAELIFPPAQSARP